MSLSSSNTIDTGVHLIHLCSECIKVSIHALKLRYDHLEGHTTRRKRKADVDGVEEAGGVAISVCGRFGQSWASLRLMVAVSVAYIIEK